MKIRLIAVLMAAAASLSAVAAQKEKNNGQTPDPLQDAAIKQQVQDALKVTFGKDSKIDEIGPGPMKDFYQVVIDNKVLYYSLADDRLVIGTVWGKDGRNYTQETLNAVAAKKIAGLPLDKALKIGTGPRKIIEFTDPDCPYCQQMATAMKAELSSATRYIFFSPITQIHPESMEKVVHIFCAKDPAEMFQRVMERRVAPADLISCEKGKEQAETHKKISATFGVSGTPTVVLGSEVIAGFKRPQIMSYLHGDH